MIDWIAYLIAIGIMILIGYAVFYPTFKEWVNEFWERMDRIKRKLEEETEEAW